MTTQDGWASWINVMRGGPATFYVVRTEDPKTGIELTKTKEENGVLHLSVKENVPGAEGRYEEARPTPYSQVVLTLPDGSTVQINNITEAH